MKSGREVVLIVERVVLNSVGSIFCCPLVFGKRTGRASVLLIPQSTRLAAVLSYLGI
jgi:hypothetical protein